MSFCYSMAVEQHLQINGESLDSYDYVLYDVETLHFASRNLWLSAAVRVWVSDYERYNLERGKGWLEQLFNEHELPDELAFQRMLINGVDCRLEAHYLWTYLRGGPIHWTGSSLIFHGMNSVRGQA